MQKNSWKHRHNVKKLSIKYNFFTHDKTSKNFSIGDKNAN